MPQPFSSRYSTRKVGMPQLPDIPKSHRNATLTAPSRCTSSGSSATRSRTPHTPESNHQPSRRGFAFRLQTVVVPSLRISTKPALCSRWMCFEIAGRLIRKFRAIPPTVCPPTRRIPKISRRVGSATARNTASRCVRCMETIKLPLKQSADFHLSIGCRRQ